MIIPTHLPTLRRAAIALVAVVATLLTGLAAAPQSEARVPSVSRTLASRPIESAWTQYVPQRGCDSAWKPGTRKLVALLHRTYPNVYAQGEYRCGTDGGVSEHYEGRAIDWMASVRTTTTRNEAESLVHWLLATDSRGNRYAMARRLGVMYIIWNNHIWGSWDGRVARYNNCVHTPSRAQDNACHRTHVHISLTWNGATGRTSFWGHAVTATDYGICAKHGRYTGYRSRHC